MGNYNSTNSLTPYLTFSDEFTLVEKKNSPIYGDVKIFRNKQSDLLYGLKSFVFSTD